MLFKHAISWRKIFSQPFFAGLRWGFLFSPLSALGSHDGSPPDSWNCMIFSALFFVEVKFNTQKLNFLATICGARREENSFWAFFWRCSCVNGLLLSCFEVKGELPGTMVAKWARFPRFIWYFQDAWYHRQGPHSQGTPRNVGGFWKIRENIEMLGKMAIISEINRQVTFICFYGKNGLLI